MVAGGAINFYFSFENIEYMKVYDTTWMLELADVHSAKSK